MAARPVTFVSGSARTIVVLLLCFSVVQARAAEQMGAAKDALIASALEQFWGRARDSNGAAIQPTSELDRRTVPIPKDIAYRAIDAGEISGLAAWCRLDWESHYLSITAAARQRGMSDKQVAFISVLHGMKQGKSLGATTSPCSESDRSRVAKQLAHSIKVGLGSPDTSRESGL
jgi:hypothetical protein